MHTRLQNTRRLRHNGRHDPTIQPAHLHTVAPIDNRIRRRKRHQHRHAQRRRPLIPRIDGHYGPAPICPRVNVVPSSDVALFAITVPASFASFIVPEVCVSWFRRAIYSSITA